MKKPESWSRLAPRLADLLNARTRDVIDQAFTEVDDALFNLSQSGERGAWLESLRKMRGERERMAEGWEAFIRDCFLKWPPRILDEGNQGEELSLLEEEDLERSLAIEQLSSVFEVACKRQLPSLLRILESIARHEGAQTDKEGGSDLIQKCPCHPQGFAHMVDAWARQGDVEQGAHLVVLKVFGRVMVMGYSRFVGQALTVFHQSGWEDPRPQDDRTPKTQSAVERRSPADNEVDSAPRSGPELLDDGNTQDFIGNRRMGGGYDFSHGIPQDYGYGAPRAVGGGGERDERWMRRQMGQILRRFQSLWGGGLDTYDALDGESESTDSNEALGFRDNQQAQPADDFSFDDFDMGALDLLRALEQKRRVRQARRKQGKSLDEKRTATMSEAAVRSVLDVMQHDVPEPIRIAARTNEASLAEQVKDEMAHKAAELGVAEEDSHLNEQDENAVDVVGMLFEIFLSERLMTDDTREKIVTLLVPYIKAAMTDRKVFLQRTHPARRLLDIIAEACDGNTGTTRQERAVLDRVAKAIDGVVRDYNEDAAIFAESEQEIRSFITHQRRIAKLAEKRAAQSQQGQEALAVARRQAGKLFGEQTDKLSWPRKTHQMLHDYWVQHHTMLLLREPDNPSRHKESEDLLLKLISVGNGGVKENPKLVRALHKRVLDMLGSSGVVDKSAEQSAVELWTALDQASQWSALSSGHVSHTETKASYEEETETPEEGDPEVKKAFQEFKGARADEEASGSENHDEMPSLEDLRKYFEDMPIGTWVDFLDDIRGMVPAKLSWISPISQKRLFVTARGMRHSTHTPEDLAMLVLMRRLRLRDVGVGEHGFAHSLHKAAQILEQRVAEEGAEEVVPN